jgi:hypothetical protein
MVLLFFILLLVGGIAAGFIGSLVGLGGAIVLVPLLSIGLGVPLYYATGSALIATIATSSGAASAYVKDRITNVKIGMSLEIATTLGAIAGSLLAAYIYKIGALSIIFVVFGIVLLSSVYQSFKKRKLELPKRMRPDSTTRIFQLEGSYYDEYLKRRVKYHGIRWFQSEAIMLAAGVISGLLGVGSGVLKVLSMDQAMNLPQKVSTTTSNFMIGVTAAVGTAIYWKLGYIQPFIAGTAAIGVLIGAYIGSKKLNSMRNVGIRMLFIVVLVVLGVEMILRGIL